MKRLFLLVFLFSFAVLTFAQSIPVTFKVDMNVAAALNEFSPPDIIAVAGNFTNWGTEPFKLTDPDDDLIYTGTLDTFDINDTLIFKFAILNSSNNSNISWENDPNREYVVTGSNDIYDGYWNNLSPGEFKDITVTFIANMECEIKSGRFNPATDTLTVRGNFNGWSSTDILHQSETDSNKFKIDINYNGIIGSRINYKYAYMTKNGVGWESDPNKEYTITQEDYDKGSAEVLRTFNNIGCIPVLNQPAMVTFQVDMNDAVSAVTGNPFDEIENVIITGANSPFVWPGAGWPNEDSIGIFHLNDNGIEGDSLAGDNIWSTKITFPIYTGLTIEYKYGANWGLPTNTGSNDNENNTGEQHYIKLEENLVSAKVMNIWNEMGVVDIYDKKYQIVDVKQTSAKVEKYSIEQNYPNPFNPSTKISFAIPEAGIVSLKVYNILGQEVKSLVNEFKSAGRYEVNFDASNLSTGTYIYRISVNDFSLTKKMMLVK